MLVCRPIVAFSQADPLEPITIHFDRGVIGYTIGAGKEMVDMIAPFSLFHAMHDAVCRAGLDPVRIG